MKREVIEMTIEEIYKRRNDIYPAEFQREPKLWQPKDKQLLIDSIINDIDIPKLYFHPVGKKEFEVIDGQQRLWAIWQFIDNEYQFKINGEDKTFNDLNDELKEKIRNYKLQITLIRNVSISYLRELFLRLQLGLLLVTGEKLHAMSGEMKNFVYDKMVCHDFIKTITMSIRRYSKQTLCAQICINSFSKVLIGDFARTRYDDLRYFFKQYEQPVGKDLEVFNKQTKIIMQVLDVLHVYYGEKDKELRNRSYILTIYLFVEELIKNQSESDISIVMNKFVDFTIKLWQRIKQEAKAGFRRENEELYIFESFLNNAPGEKYQIARRHLKMKEFFEHYEQTGLIKGD
jgi:hypothetical protein